MKQKSKPTKFDRKRKKYDVILPALAKAPDFKNKGQKQYVPPKDPKPNVITTESMDIN